MAGWRRACAVALGVVMSLSVGVAQEYSDTTSVIVVEVPVNVTRDGDPVLGLTADDFEILDEGKKQEILGFEVIDLREATSTDRVRSMSAAARRHFVLVFDLTFSDPNAVARSRAAALDLVRTSLHPTDLISVATYSNRQGPRLIINFTTDRRQVEQAISTLGLVGRQTAHDDPLGLVVEAGISADLAPGTDEGGGGRAGGIVPDVEIQEALERVEGQSAQADKKRQVDIFASTFGFLAQMLAPLDGRKHVVFLSEGFDAEVLLGTADEERITELQQAVEFGQIWDVNNDERFGNSQSLGQIYSALQDFKQADAAIHAIDIGGMRTDGGGRASRGRQDGLAMLSSETDGEFYRNYNDLSGAMGEMLERTSVTYLLAFQPSDPRRKRDSFHRLRVKLKDEPRGTHLSYRQGYYPPEALGTLDETQRNLRAAQQIHSAAPTEGVSARILAAPLAAGDSRAYVPLLLQIPGSELTRGPTGEQLPLEIYAYAMDGEGGVKDYFAESLTFDMASVGTALATTGLKYYGHLNLEPGDYALRVMVRDGRTGATSVEVVPLSVPEFDESTLAVLPPLFPEGTEHWVMVRESTERAEERPVAYPFLFKGQSFVPAVYPVFEPEQVVAVSLMATNRNNSWLEVGGLVLSADGAPVPGTFLRVLERERDTEAGIERMIAAFEVPNLPSGEYELVVTMSDNTTGAIESGSLAFSLGSQGETATLFTPPPWMPDLEDIVAQLGPDPSQRSIVKLDRAAFEAGYRDALRALAEGRQNGAVLQLAELEGSLVNPENPMSSLAQMGKVQGRVLDELTRSDEDLLLPAILLHKEAYSQYRLRKEPYLAVHARQTTLELVDLYAKKAKTERARRLASRVLTSMAAEVYGSGAHISARAMFERAIELDKTNGVALLGLGFMNENMGQGDQQTPKYDHAVEALERAVAVAPDLHEARLRLAVNLGRMERSLDGARHLQMLIDRADVPPWILSLAYQELARLYMAKGSYDNARRVLERGVARLPDESKLSLQLAYVYERMQMQAQANRAAGRATGATLSARYLYLQVPQLLEESSTLWAREAEGRLPALAAALGPVRAGVGR